MKKTLALILAVVLAASLFTILASAADQVVVNSVTYDEKLKKTSTLYLGEVVVNGDPAIKYVYSDDVTASENLKNRVILYLGKMTDGDYAALLDNLVCADPAAKGLFVCSDGALTADEAFKDAASVGERYYPGAEQISVFSQNAYDADEGFRDLCDTEETADKDSFWNFVPAGKRVKTREVTGSVDSVTYTVIDGKLVKIVDTLVYNDLEATTVILTRVELSVTETATDEATSDQATSEAPTEEPTESPEIPPVTDAPATVPTEPATQTTTDEPVTEGPAEPMTEPDKPSEPSAAATEPEKTDPVTVPTEPTEPADDKTDKPDDPATQPTEPAERIVCGDLDGDGNVTAADARSALRIAVKLDQADEKKMKAADVDGADGVTAADARLILRFAVKLETAFPAESV